MCILDQISSYAGALEPGVRLPEIQIPERFYKKLGIDPSSSNSSFLSQYCDQQLSLRHLNNDVYKNRLKIELDVINDLGFVDYILLNWDIINYCAENGIPTGSGRGSAASSLVLFLLDVTKIDPIRYGLIFERFINKARAKKIFLNGINYLDGSLLPDVDSDISYDRRQQVIEYIEKKYHGKTAKILTLNTLSSKICLKEVAKTCLNVTEMESRELSDMIPKHFGKVDSIAKAWKESVKLQAWGIENKRTLEIARKLEGLNKNVGVHASGIAISFYPLTDICPVGKTKDGQLVVYYTKDDTANLMVKFDILGLRTLTVASDTCKLLNIDIESIDPETPEIYDHLQDLQTPKGLFQIEAETNYRVCRKVKPKNLSALSDVIAIGRPGALAYLNEYVANNQDVQDDLREVNPKLHEILNRTNGVPLYQEQLLKIASDVFKFTLSEAETLRKVVGRKLVEEVKAWEPKIYAKAIEVGLDKSVADFYWKLLNDSANYSFNLSHSISYSTLAAKTTYLKFKHPKEFFLSLLRTSKFEQDPHSEIAVISKELVYFDIKLLHPDLIKSQLDFSIEGNDIRYGLNSIKGVSDTTLLALQSFREKTTPTKFDVFIAAQQAKVNIGLLNSLIRAGTLHSYTEHRSRLVLEAQCFNKLTVSEKKFAVAVGEKYNWDILTIISECAVKNQTLNEKGKPFMSEKRLATFRESYEKYKALYENNKKHEKFSNWYFENKLLGYSPNLRLKDVFDQPASSFTDCMELISVSENDQVKIVGMVDEVYEGKSKKTNKPFIRIAIRDDVGSTKGLLMDAGKSERLTEFLQYNGKIPEKGDVVVLTARKGKDIVWIESVSIVEDKAFMKTSELEKADEI